MAVHLSSSLYLEAKYHNEMIKRGAIPYSFYMFFTFKDVIMEYNDICY